MDTPNEIDNIREAVELVDRLEERFQTGACLVDFSYPPDFDTLRMSIRIAFPDNPIQVRYVGGYKEESALWRVHYPYIEGEQCTALGTGGTLEEALQAAQKRFQQRERLYGDIAERLEKEGS